MPKRSVHDLYPYAVKWPRTNNWWLGEWHELSDFCRKAFGSDQWEYLNESFVFQQAKHRDWFVLRWGPGHANH